MESSSKCSNRAPGFSTVPLEIILQILVFPVLAALYWKLDNVGTRLARAEAQIESDQEQLRSIWRRIHEIK